MDAVVVSVRTGVFCTPAGVRLLAHVLDNETTRVRDDDIRVVHSLLKASSCAPNASEFSKRIARTTASRRAEHELTAREFDAMERIREAIALGPSRTTRSHSRSRRRSSASVISESTNVGSAFSRAP